MQSGLSEALVGCGCVLIYWIALYWITLLNHKTSAPPPTSPPAPRSQLVITESVDGPDYERAFAVLSVRLVEISPVSRAKLARLSRGSHQIVREASPLPQQSWVASREGILYEEPRAWQAHCYAACWYVFGHQYMEPEVQGCPAVAPYARGDGEGLWPPYLARPRGEEGLHLRGGVLGLASSDWVSHMRDTLPGNPMVSAVPTLWVSLHAPVFSEVNINSAAVSETWARWTAQVAQRVESGELDGTPGKPKKPQCPFLWLYPWDVLVTVCRFAAGQGCPIDWVRAVVAFADGREEPWERDGDREPITREWIETNIGLMDLLYERPINDRAKARGYRPEYLPLDAVPEKLRGFLRKKWLCKWAQDEYDDRMQFIGKQQDMVQACQQQ